MNEERRRRRPPGLTPEEVRLFREAMKEATPLSPDRVAPLTDADPEPVPVKQAIRNMPLPLPPAAPLVPPAGAKLPELRAGSPAGVDARRMDRLRRGQIRPEGRLDLHGMTQDKAQTALRNFILAAHRDGRRCVIVITGKGGLASGGGVLRREVPRWLNLSPLRGAVLGFAEAQPKDGGGGALYVLIKRRRAVKE